MAEREQYVLGHSEAEDERLRRQAEELEQEARWLLDRVGVRPGARALDVGCGPRGILELLSERVGPQGTVVGIERDRQSASSARKLVEERQLANVQVMRGDAKATGLRRDSFDVVHARLVLVNVPEPERVVEEMVALARPGGMVASHEADFVPHLCDPPCAAWNRLFEVFAGYSRANGIDLFVGRRTHRMFRDAGIVDLQVRPLVHVYEHGHNRRTIFWDFMTNVRERVVAHGLIREPELATLMDELRRHLDDPRTLVVSHLFFQVWGRKPTLATPYPLS